MEDIDLDQYWAVQYRSVFFMWQVKKFYTYRHEAEEDFKRFQIKKNYIQSGWEATEIIPPQRHRIPKESKKN